MSSLSSVHQTIKTAYELENMSPEEIAADQELEVTAVKAALMQCSSKYRKACGQEPEEEDGLNFSNDELRQVNRVIFEAAISAEHPDGTPDWKVRAQCAQYIRDDKKGRKDVVKQVAGNTFNILNFNEQMQQARKLKEAVTARLLNA